MALPHHVDPHRFKHAGEVHAAVLEKSPVFYGHYGIDHHFRNVGVLNYLALGALLVVEQRGYELRLQFIGGKLIAFAGDAIDLAVVNGDVRRFRTVVTFGARRDLDAVADQVKAAERRLAVLIGISSPAQETGDLLGLEFIAVV